MMRYQRKNKYKNVKSEVDGIKFDSKKEARRYNELMELLKTEDIKDLKLQPTFTLQEAFKTISGESVRAITYKADFSYKVKWIDENGEIFWKLVVEDVKGIKTEAYKLKAKMMLDKYGIKVKEI